ncbi:hypothetical protein ACQEVX_12030 [Streptomyces syringium]|uniref:hypothetical protein n=1 Tax=Streptomyces syringium TaxID=76729 RepID=UPI003D90F512
MESGSSGFPEESAVPGCRAPALSWAAWASWSSLRAGGLGIAWASMVPSFWILGSFASGLGSSAFLASIFPFSSTP